MNGLLNAAQAQSLRISLQTLEERLRRADAWLAGMEEAGVLYHRALALAPQQRAEARTHIAEALALVAALAHTFATEREIENVASQIRAEMSASWVDLCDTRASKLRRYGEVNPALAEILDAPLERLAALALRIAALMDVPEET